MNRSSKNNQRTLYIKFGQFTDKKGIDVYERFERAVNATFKSPISSVEQIHSTLSKEKIKESIVVRALDQYLAPLSDKEAFETRIEREISDEIWDTLKRTDAKYIPAEELIKICREHGISIGKRDKKELALELYDRGIILL